MTQNNIHEGQKYFCVKETRPRKYILTISFIYSPKPYTTLINIMFVVFMIYCQNSGVKQVTSQNSQVKAYFLGRNRD